MTARILIIGGSGVFGKRLARHLSSDGDVSIFVSSRRLAKAQDVAHSIDKAASAVIPVELDCQINLIKVLEDVQPIVVVDCSGPFQSADYRTAQTALAVGAHFVDLADARGYLAGFVSALDRTARDQGVTALTGASSTPTLSTAAAVEIAADWRRVDSVDICITPGGKSEVGRSVIEAILSYAGQDVPIWRNGRLAAITGWGDGAQVDMPGLGTRRVAPVETFDAEYLGPLMNVQSRVSFSAGLEAGIEQRGIETLAALRKLGLIGSLKPLISMLLIARKLTRIVTSDTGGMLVDMRGVDSDGVETRVKWCLVAEQDHGPFIPVMPAAAAIRKLLRAEAPVGAYMAHHAVQLTDILDEMSRYSIRTEMSVKKAEAAQGQNPMILHPPK